MGDVHRGSKLKLFILFLLNGSPFNEMPHPRAISYLPLDSQSNTSKICKIIVATQLLIFPFSNSNPLKTLLSPFFFTPDLNLSNPCHLSPHLPSFLTSHTPHRLPSTEAHTKSLPANNPLSTALLLLAYNLSLDFPLPSWKPNPPVSPCFFPRS